MSDQLKNFQTKQPHIEYPPEGNGWPEPLTDPSSPLGKKVTVGRNGESMEGQVTTSQQREGAHHAPEGKYAASPTQAPTTDQKAPSPFATSGFVSDPAGRNDPPATMAPYDESAVGRANKDPIHTTQQVDKAHKLVEGR